MSVNPFKMLPIYSPQIMAEYRTKLAQREVLAPHVYALADAAYKNLVADEQNQSVIISFPANSHFKNSKINPLNH